MHKKSLSSRTNSSLIPGLYFKQGNSSSSIAFQDLLNGLSALAFVDNHDNQRNHGGGGNILTYKVKLKS